MKLKIFSTTIIIATAFLLSDCKKKTDDAGNPVASTQISTSCTDLNVFSINRDITLGAQVNQQIRATPAEYNILDSAASTNNADAYKYMYKIRDEIFNNAAVDYEKEFPWKIAIIKDDATLNAFCTPGGYIFVYTGLIKYLDNEDDFAGVLGHEIGHAALRHSTDRLVKQYGVSFLLSAIGGDKSQLATIVANLTLLKYSRCHETQSDEYSVALLNKTKYKCNGAAAFFEKIVESGGSGTPAFLSTHPDPGNRVENINAQATKLNCTLKESSTSTDWAKLKSVL
jgi:predicted Zn-dependent protease